MATTDNEVCPVCKRNSKRLSSHFRQSPSCQKTFVTRKQRTILGIDNDIPNEIGGDEETNIDRQQDEGIGRRISGRTRKMVSSYSETVRRVQTRTQESKVVDSLPSPDLSLHDYVNIP